MQFTKEHLDTPFADLYEDSINFETPREFIRASEKKFEMESRQIDSMDDEELNAYIESLDYLWEISKHLNEIAK